MRGRILGAATTAQPGVISSEDGRRYHYTVGDMRGMPGRAGQDVDFEPQGSDAREIYVVGIALPAVVGAKRDWVSFYLSPSGRLSRREYWLYGFLVILIANILIGWIPIIGQIFTLVTSWASIAIAAKRFHDVDRSGWWMLAPAVPMALAGIGLLMTLERSTEGVGFTLAVIFGLVALGTNLWILFGVLIRAGDAGPNRFGPAPVPASA